MYVWYFGATNVFFDLAIVTSRLPCGLWVKLSAVLGEYVSLAISVYVHCVG